jgi:hypothetical protein
VWFASTVRPFRPVLTVQGGDLRHALSADQGFAWYGAGQHIALDVARGLHFLHSSSVIHRRGPQQLDTPARKLGRLCSVSSAATYAANCDNPSVE